LHLRPIAGERKGEDKKRKQNKNPSNTKLTVILKMHAWLLRRQRLAKICGFEDLCACQIPIASYLLFKDLFRAEAERSAAKRGFMRSSIIWLYSVFIPMLVEGYSGDSV